MTGRGARALSGRVARARSRGRARGRVRGGRNIRGFRGSHKRQRGDFGPVTVTVNRNEGRERDYIVEDSYAPKHYPERYDESEYYHYRSRSRSWSRSRSRTGSRTLSRSRSRSISRSPYRRVSHHRHYSRKSRSRSRSYTPPRRRSRSFSRSISRSPSPRSPPRYRVPHHEITLERISSSSRKHEEEIRRREQIDRAEKKPVDRQMKQIKKEQVKVVKEQVKAVKEQVKAAKEQVKIVKEQFRKMTPLQEVAKKETIPSPVKEPEKLPATVRDMPIYSDESDDELDSRLTTPQAKKEERFKFETDINKDIRSQLLERAMIEKKKLGLENPGAAEKSSALEALQCYSPETHSPSPTSQRNYDTPNIHRKEAVKKKKVVCKKKGPLMSIFEPNGDKTESLPSIPGLGFSSIEDEEKFLYGDDNEKDNKNASGDEEEEEEEEDDNVGIGQTAIATHPEINVKMEAIPKAAVKTGVVEAKDWGNNQSNLTFQDIPTKRRRLLTSDDDDTTDFIRGEMVSKHYAGSTLHPEIIERKYSASDMIDFPFSEKLHKSVKDSPSQFSKSSLSPPVKKAVEKANRLEFSPQFDVKQHSVASRRKDNLEERHLMHQSPSSDYERKYSKTEKCFHPAVPGQRSKREDSPPRKEYTPRYRNRHELFEETERKQRERNRKTEERSRNWEASPRNRSFDGSPWRSSEEKKKWEDYHSYSHSPRPLSLERDSCHSRSPRESYYDRSPSNSPRRWSSPRAEASLTRWSPRQELSPKEGDNSNIDWLQGNHRDCYYDRQPSPSQSPDGTQSRSPKWKKEYENAYQQQAPQSFDNSSVDTYAISQQLSCANAESTETAVSYSMPQQSYYQSIGGYPSVSPQMTYPPYNTFPQIASYSAPFQSNITMPPTVIQVAQQPLTRTPNTVTRTNLTVVPLHNEVETTKHDFPILEDERKKRETSKRSFVTISDNSYPGSNEIPSIDYSVFSYKELLDKKADKNKHLALLQNEMAKLCKMQGELMRKKQKEKDGHKDALIVENAKLQEEVANQIQESKREVLQIRLAIRRCLEEAEKEKELKRQQRRIEEEQKEEYEKEQHERQQQKRRMEEKVEEASDDHLDSGMNFNFKYFDPGNHWCKYCNEVHASILKLFEHLHSSKHKQKIDPCDRPWVTLNQKRESEKSLGSQTIAAPIKGVQFLVPLEGFYCSICKEVLPDAVSAEDHLKSIPHNRSYTKYILLNPFYERKWNLEKAAGISAAEREEKKRHKELSLEAKNKKREEAEKRRKEFIKKEKAKEIKRIYDIPAVPLSNNKPFETSADKEASKPKHKAIRLTLLGDKSKFTKQKKEEKTLPPKETKSVPVIYIGKAPNFRSMAHKQDKEKQDVSGFGKFNWKKDENEIVPEEQTLVSKESKTKQGDQIPKAEEAEQKETVKNFPLRKNKKPQLNLVYGPEPPPDLHLRESQQAPPTPEKDDGVLPSETDIAQAFAGKFEGNESSTTSKNQYSDSSVNKETFFIIDETSPPKHETLEEEIKPTATLKETVRTGPSRQMMLMLKSVENMSKEANSNSLTSKLNVGAYKSHSLLAKTENSHLTNKPVVAVTGNVSRIQPMQMATVLRPPGEEDIFVTENINVKPPPLKPQLSRAGPSESFTGNANISSWSENINKPTEVVVGNMNRPSVTVVGSANKSATSTVNKCEGVAVGETKVLVPTAGSALTTANKSNLTETENTNEAAIPNETLKHSATKENESRAFPIMTGNVARIQPQKITNISKSEEMSLTFAKTVERIKSEVIPVSQTASYQEGIDSAGSTACMVPVTRPKVQVIFPTIKTTETDAVLKLEENLVKNQLSVESMPNVLKIPSECAAESMVSKDELDTATMKSPPQAIIDGLCDSAEDDLSKSEQVGAQCEPEIQSKYAASHSKEIGENHPTSATERISGMVSNEIKEVGCSLIALQDEKKATSVLSHEMNNNQTFHKIETGCSLREEWCGQTGTFCKGADEKNSITKTDCSTVTVNDMLQVENEICGRPAKQENVTETVSESEDQKTVKKITMLHLTTDPSIENSSTLSIDKILQNEKNENINKESSISSDIEASATNSSIFETKYQQQVHNEAVHTKNENVKNNESEHSSKLLSDNEVTETIKNSVNVVDTSNRQFYTDNKAEQTGDRISYNNGEEIEVKHKSDRVLSSREGAILSSTVPDIPLEEDEQKEQGNVSVVANFGNSLHSELKPCFNSESHACSGDINVAKEDQKQGVIENAILSEEKVDPSAHTKSSNLYPSSEKANTACICTEEVENMEVGPSNNNYSDNKRLHIGIFSEVNASQNISKGSLKLEEDSQSLYDKQEKTSIWSAAGSDISFSIKTNAANSVESTETMEVDTDLNSYGEVHCPIQISTSKDTVIASQESVEQEKMEHTLCDKRQGGNMGVSAEPCSIPCGNVTSSVLLQKAGSSLIHDSAEQLLAAKAAGKTENMEIDSDLNFQDERHFAVQVSGCCEAAVPENISKEIMKQDEQNSYGKIEQQVAYKALNDDRLKDNASIEGDVKIGNNKHEISASVKDERLSDTAKASFFSSENETSGTIDIAGKSVDIAKKPLPLKPADEIKHSIERETDLVVKAETATSIIVEDTATEKEVEVTKNDQLNDTASNKIGIHSSCAHSDTGCSCDEGALNLNEDTVEFCESFSPKEHIPGNIENDVNNIPNIVTFPETEAKQREHILSFERDKECSTKLSASLETSINLKSEKIGNSIELSSVVDNTTAINKTEVDAKVKVTSSPQEATNEIEGTGLVIPVGFSSTQHAEEKAGSPMQRTEEKLGGYIEEKIVIGSSFGIDEADATIQALENLLEETKQLHSPASKSCESKEVEQSSNSDVRQKSE